MKRLWKPIVSHSEYLHISVYITLFFTLYLFFGTLYPFLILYLVSLSCHSKQDWEQELYHITHLFFFSGEGNGTPLQYSCLENPMDGGAWWAAVHGVTKSRTRQSNFSFTFHFHTLEKEMATHSSVLAWRIPGTAEPGGLPSMGSHRVGHDWSDLAAAAEYF